MDTDAQELAELRRLLKEKTEKLEGVEKGWVILRDQLNKVLTLVVGESWADSPDFMEAARRSIEEAKALYRERSERILHVFGCAACGGEHRGIWTQALNPVANVMHMGTAAQIECQRAYVCPLEREVVLVSNESEDTYRG